MRKGFWIAIIAVIATLFILVPSIFDMLFAILFIGIIPKTPFTIPAPIMVGIDALLITIAVVAIAHQLAKAADPVKQDLACRERARRKVLKMTAPKSSQPKNMVRIKKHFLPLTEH